MGGGARCVYIVSRLEELLVPEQWPSQSDQPTASQLGNRESIDYLVLSANGQMQAITLPSRGWPSQRKRRHGLPAPRTGAPKGPTADGRQRQAGRKPPRLGNVGLWLLS